MRIIGGQHKGRRLIIPQNLILRPTTDFAKEGLFNILHNIFGFGGAVVLDLFSGTGSISYEFCSRGAGNVTAVEINPKHIAYIKEVAGKLNLNLRVVRANVFLYLKKTKSEYDLIFCDPPYTLKGIEEIPELVFERNLLNKGGWLIIEHSSKVDFTECEHFTMLRKFGSVNFSFFR